METVNEIMLGCHGIVEPPFSDTVISEEQLPVRRRVELEWQAMIAHIMSKGRIAPRRSSMALLDDLPAYAALDVIRMTAIQVEPGGTYMTWLPAWPWQPSKSP